MSPVELTIDLDNKTVTIDWSALTEDQLHWLAVSQGVENTPEMIPLLIAAGLKRKAADAAAAYKVATPDPRDAAAPAIAAMAPTM